MNYSAGVPSLPAADRMELSIMLFGTMNFNIQKQQKPQARSLWLLVLRVRGVLGRQLPIC